MGAAALDEAARAGRNAASSATGLNRIRERLGIDARSPEGLARTLPFTRGDATAGVENELQAAVAGVAEAVDLPRTIRRSRYYRNRVQMAEAGDLPARSADALTAFLEENRDDVWENSWVRFAEDRLSGYTRRVFERDLRADKGLDGCALRKDCDRFRLREGGEARLRVPVSYLLKLGLAEAVACEDTHPEIRATAESLYGHFLSDNTSPEITSFHPVGIGADAGRAVAAETAGRYLLCHLVVQYASSRFGLAASGQRAMVYFAPQPPLRQKQLNELISDAFYRELFMSPCLSGWDRGEEKHAYMARCHKVLSRSQLHVLKKLKASGIVSNNLVVLPDISNTSLANNGTHLSIGSRKLTALRSAEENGLAAADEKYIGDLVIKTVEHFLPLFVGTYSAAPRRLDFWDFHPEKALGFLPHELNYTHLRQIWRQWKKKADLKVLSRALTPFGPEWLDRSVSRLLGLRGDLIPDSRLVDYLVCLMSTPSSSALDGRLGSDLELKKDLAALGIFDPAMPLYLLYRLRTLEANGFSGFEGRFYSQFESLHGDLGRAAALQQFVTALAYQYAMTGATTHLHIPDHPRIESERRQFFFAAAVGVPVVYAHRKTRNRFLKAVLSRVESARPSRRSPEYLAVRLRDYCLALVSMMREDGAALIECLAVGEVIDDLEERLRRPEERSTAARLVRGILDEVGARSPFQLTGSDFNGAAERHYRGRLRRRHLEEAFPLLEAKAAALDSWEAWRSGRFNRPMLDLLAGRGAADYVRAARPGVLRGTASEAVLRTLIHLTLLGIAHDRSAPR
jgi:hypothetical protein